MQEPRIDPIQPGAESAAGTAPAPKAAPGPEPKAAPRAPERPVRRVGSVTLGFALIAAGVFFLGYYFWPGFNWALALKLAPPAGLVLMGAEVLYSACRPGKWKYDFLSAFACLLLMGGALGLSLLPLGWNAYGPARYAREEALSDQYSDQLYAAFAEQAGQVELKSVRGNVRLMYSEAPVESLDLGSEEARLYLWVELYGPYEEAEPFAADCRALLDVIQSQQTRPDKVYFYYEEADGEDYSRLSLDLTAPVQLDWDLEHLTRQTETEGRFARPSRPDRDDAEAGPAPDAQDETALETA